MNSGPSLTDSLRSNLSVSIRVHLWLICISSVAIVWRLRGSVAHLYSGRGRDLSESICGVANFFQFSASWLPIPKAKALEWSVAAWTETGVRRSDYRQPALSLRQAPKIRLVASPGTAKE